MDKLNAKELRKIKGSRRVRMELRREIYIVLDNVLDTYNIGSIFRLADAVAAKKLYLCGGTEIPPNHRIKKASINTTEVVDWEYCESAVEAIKKVKRVQGKGEKVMVVAIEQSANSIPYSQFDYQLPICLVVGHESEGVSKEVLDLADGVVELPMLGINKSLNVMVSLSVVLYRITADLKLNNNLTQKSPKNL